LRLTRNSQDNTSTDTVSWIVVAERKDAIEAALAQNIYNQEHPTTANGLPWVTPVQFPNP